MADSVILSIYSAKFAVYFVFAIVCFARVYENSLHNNVRNALIVLGFTMFAEATVMGWRLCARMVDDLFVRGVILSSPWFALVEAVATCLTVALFFVLQKPSK